MRIAVDAMGGDFAPREVVKGALNAAHDLNGEIILVGETEQIRACLPKRYPSSIRLEHASQVVEMADSPVRTVKTKPDSSLVKAAQMVKNGDADAMVTAGNTGAAVAVSKLLWNMIPGIERPAIATVLPSLSGHVVLLDSGATTDCEAEWLLQFALMGEALSQRVLNVEKPRIGLLNIGEERGKGNAVTKRAYELIHSQMPCFAGNIEGKDLFSSSINVVVCDGFVGNIVLKTGEGLAMALVQLLKEELPKTKVLLLPLLLYRGAKKRFEKRLDYAEYGGAPLLGVNGICIIAHGRSNAKAIASAITEAAKAVEQDLISTIRTSIASHRLEGANA